MKISGWFHSRVAGPLLDALYPPRCELCEVPLRGGRALCDGCDSGLARLEEPFCRHCGQPFFGLLDSGIECPNCHGKKLGFDFARPVLRRCGESMDLVHRLKYGKRLYLARELGRIAAEALEDPRFDRARDEQWPLVPVPLHRSRLFKREFNQAEEIARVMARATGLPVCHALRRVRATSTQTTLHRKERFENLKGAFELTRAGRKRCDERVPGIILVDDVLTTGSTLGACARVLRKAGCRTVAAVAVVRG
jgi:ComF family protein